MRFGKRFIVENTLLLGSALSGFVMITSLTSPILEKAKNSNKISCNQIQTDSNSQPIFTPVATVSVAKEEPRIAQASLRVVKPQTVAPLALSSLPLRLISTSSDTNTKVAIIENKETNAQDVFSPESLIFGLAKLVEVRSDSIVIENKGKLEQLFKSSAAIPAVSLPVEDPVEDLQLAAVEEQQAWEKFGADDDATRGPLEVNEGPETTVRVIDRVKFARNMKSIPSLMYDTNPKIVDTSEGTVGLALETVTPDTIIADAGLESGDVIKSINGEKFTGMLSIPSVIRKGLRSSIVDIEVERNGRTHLLSVSSRYSDQEDSGLTQVAEQVRRFDGGQGREAVADAEKFLEASIAAADSESNNRG